MIRSAPATLQAFRLLWHVIRSAPQAEETVEYPFRKPFEYPGPDGKKAPGFMFVPLRKSKMTILLFPGASPYGEQHPFMNTVGAAAARSGLQVFLPRIPPLMRLEHSPRVLEWMVYAYDWIYRHPQVKGTSLTILGVSFGGALVLKLCLNPRITAQSPKSILVYGSYFNIRTAMEYILTGKMEYQGRTIQQTPDSWAVIVLLHNYLNRVDAGYSTDNVQHVLQLRVQNNIEDAEKTVEDLTGKEKELAEGILSDSVTDEMQRIVRLILAEDRPEFRELSPEYWVADIHIPTFVLHGAGDPMAPFTESIKLGKALPDSRLLISRVFAHNALDAGGENRFKQLIYTWQTIRFIADYLRFNQRE